jgi:hypothetical protein
MESLRRRYGQGLRAGDPGYFIPDFSNWKDNDSYQQAFQRLLKDLKAERGDSE